MQRPVHLVTGFLGSGKTTLVARMLRDPAFADTAVVVNELGEVGLDHLLVDRGSEEDVVLLESGCLCCALGNSLQETLEGLHYRRERAELPAFARVVVETTGVADPGRIAATLGLDSAIARHYRLGSIVTVVDVLHGSEQIRRFAEARQQVAVADRLIVTKTDLAEPGASDRLGAELAVLNPHALRIEAIAGDVPVADVFVDALEAKAWRLHLFDGCEAEHAHEEGGSAKEHAHLDAQGIATTTIRLDAPLDWPRYADWVQWTQLAFGDRLLRMKGVVRMGDGTVRALHAVMRLFSAPAPMETLPKGMGDGVIVLITQHLPPSLLAESKRRIGGAGDVIAGGSQIRLPPR